jgi:biopolymer transport protein ExbB/TolQ
MDQIYNNMQSYKSKERLDQNRNESQKHNKLSQQLDDLSQLGKDLSRLKKQSLRTKNQLKKIKKAKIKKDQDSPIENQYQNFTKMQRYKMSVARNTKMFEN